jgi:hypothetical protein
MAYLTNLALAVTRAIDPKRLYDWMIAISAAVGSSPAIIGVGPFDTVARASANRMLDAPAASLAVIENGSEVWVESFGGGTWVWRTDFPAATATDNETTCRPTEWIATGLNGAFVREMQGKRTALTQGAWAVDSTATDNEGLGTSLDPLKTDNEIQRRWGQGARARIAQPTTITYAQSPATSSSFLVTIADGGSLTFIGTPTITKPNTVISAVQTQVRTAGSELGWAITGIGLGAADVGKLALITASVNPNSVGAYAPILKDETGGKVRVGPFGLFNATTGGYTQQTPVVGDVIEIFDPMILNLGGHDLLSATNVSPLVTGLQRVLYDSIMVAAGADNNGAISTTKVPVYFARCGYNGLILIGTQGASASAFNLRGGIVGTTGLVLRSQGISVLDKIGALGPVATSRYGVTSLTADCYFQNCTCSVDRMGNVSSSGAAFFDRAASDSTLVVFQGGFWSTLGSIPDWGTANAGHGIRISSYAAYSYITKPTVNGTLGAGREATIGGTDKLYAAVPYIEGATNGGLVLSS